MFENLRYESVDIKELHNDQECGSVADPKGEGPRGGGPPPPPPHLTLHRAAADEVSTITSYYEQLSIKITTKMPCI